MVGTSSKTPHMAKPDHPLRCLLKWCALWRGTVGHGVTMGCLALAAGVSGASPPNLGVVWNRAMLRAVEKNPPAPTATTWRLHVVSTAMYDAWAAYDARALGTRQGGAWRRPVAERTAENKAKAVSYAAFAALVAIFPNQRADFEAVMGSLGYPADTSTDLGTPEGIGNAAALAVLEFRWRDGSNAGAGFSQSVSDLYPDLYQPVNSADPASGRAPGGPEFDPNRWQPLRVPTGVLRDAAGNPIHDDTDPSTFVDQRFLTPHWGAVVPFSLTSPQQLRPPPPPRKGSDGLYVDATGKVTTEDAAWHEQVDEILRISAELTDRQKVIAEFWADGPNTWTPPGHWNQIAEGLALRDRQSLDDTIKMYFALNGALLDAAICCWEAKRAFDFIRPQSAIRHKYFGQMVEAWGGPNRGTQRIRGEEWRPYQALTFVTPAFAEFTSGHSTFSRTACAVLTGFTGTDALYDGTTRLGADYDRDDEEDWLGEHNVLPGGNLFEDSPAEKVTLRWATLTEAADEAGWSRRYGGIHFQDGDLFARQAGDRLGGQALATARALWEGLGPDLRIARGEAGELWISWSNGYFGLQSAAELPAAVWTDQGMRSPQRVAPGEGLRLFRLRQL